MRQSKTLAITAAIAVSLAACGDRETTTVISPVAVDTTPLTATSDIKVDTLGVTNVSDIKLQPVVPGTASASGFFDGVNNSPKLVHQLPKAGTVTLNGWAINPSERVPADRVIVTAGPQNAIIAIVPVNSPRPDLVKVSPSYQKAGWLATVDASKLPTGQVLLKAWAYDTEQKLAAQLNQVHSVTFTAAATPTSSPETTPEADDQPSN